MKAEDKPSTSPFDPADFLENGDAILGYLTDALACGDPAFIDDALDVTVRAAKRLGTTSAKNLLPSDCEAFFAGLGAGAELGEELQSAVARFRARTVSVAIDDADLFKERTCPSCGAQMLHDVRDMTLEYRGRSAMIGMPGWYCDECDEGVHSGDDMATSDAALERLRAELRRAFSADEPTFQALDAGQIIDRNRK
ncbi:YgiT-type zinc finger protein [Shimia haliotis]|uniref:YgiT-type zinc finger domain-containing protein n=1 Tax=Shimia haliotis TaxID=1280847 RepID=A0A1I4C8Y6_9RHOB|nr:YgiT-type zinc finger protein [Shimia haliotis]SFK77628.1 YgiT-type zinc finger domain-containing protein [Shimia haliotis]